MDLRVSQARVTCGAEFVAAVVVTTVRLGVVLLTLDTNVDVVRSLLGLSGIFICFGEGVYRTGGDQQDITRAVVRGWERRVRSSLPLTVAV